MHLMISTAGGRMADDVQHQFRLSDIRKIPGMKHHDRDSLAQMFRELRAAVLTYDDTERNGLSSAVCSMRRWSIIVMRSAAICW